MNTQPSSKTTVRNTGPPTLTTLPAEIVEHIALNASLLHPHSPPTALYALLQVNKAFYDLLRPQSNPRLYANLFRARFDTDALERRFGVGADGNVEWFSKLGLLGDGKHDKKGKQKAGSGSRVSEIPPRHEGSLVVTADSSSESQEFAAATFPALAGSSAASVPVAPPSSSRIKTPVTPLTVQGENLTARQLADEFINRIQLLRRMRKCGADDTLTSLGTDGGVTTNTPVDDEILYGEEGMRQLTKDLWAAYLMVLENDGKNLDELVNFGNIRKFLSVYYEQEMFAACTLPGYPQETPERCLAMHLSYLLIDSDELDRESERDGEEQFFVLKPYVFAAHVFDAFHAPWTLRHLPIPSESASSILNAAPEPGEPSVDAAFLANLHPKKRVQRLSYMGRNLQIAPPILSHAACRSFFLRVERDPEMAADGPLATLPGAPPPGAPGGPDASNTEIYPGSFDLGAASLVSVDHDKDFIRLTACLDPFSSQGLHPLFHLGDLTGAWEGRFSFFDFDSYRDMLSGRTMALYEGPFGDQPQVWKIEERVIRTRDGKIVRGGGTAMGMKIKKGQAVKEALARAVRAEAEAAASTSGSGEAVQGEGGRPGDDAVASLGSKAWENAMEEPVEVSEEENEPLDPDEKYEIELQGTGHSAWGQFILQGRIRSWDGMFTLTKEYTPDGRGRWLYRGYMIAGGILVGRWRDTFTPEHLSGYEGTFLMRRRVW